MLLHGISLLLLQASLALSSPTPSHSQLHILPTSTIPLASIPACVSYHGQIGTSSSGGLHSLLYSSNDCDLTNVNMKGGWSIELDWKDGEVVWSTGTEVDATVEGLLQRKAELNSGGLVMQGPSDAAFSTEQDDVIIRASLPIGTFSQIKSYSALSRMTSEPLHSLSEFVVLSSTPLPLPIASALAPTSSSPVSEHDRQRVITIQKGIKFNHLVSTLLSTLTIDQLEEDVKYLSGEDQLKGNGMENVTWTSRHSMSVGGHKASGWILEQMREMGVNCSQYSYLPHFAPLVSCEIEGTDPTAGTFVLGGHMDSRGSFGFPTAPGADDDGSGTALLLSVSRQITSHSLKFARKVRIVYFSGEEQGLLGSKAFAAKLKEEKEDVVMMLQVDMIAYQKPGEPIQMALPDLIGLDEAKWLVGNLSTIYVPELVVGETPACCSDHQSFEQNGFASTWVFERNGPIADPCYHNSCDLSARPGYSFEQVLATSKVVLATLLEVGGFAFP